MTGVCEEVAPGAAKDALPPGCTDTIELRQGASVVVDAPGVDLKNVTVKTVDGDELTTTLQRDDAGRLGVKIEAPHGATPGDSFNNQKRVVTITERIPGHDPYVRELHVIVSYIVVAPWGDDGNAGTFSKPFFTFHAAGNVAAKDDTILVRSPPTSDDPNAPPPPPLDKTDATVPSGVIVRCPDSGFATLAMALELEGDASFEMISFEGPRLKIKKPNSTVTFIKDRLTHGLTIDLAAGVSPELKDQRVKVNITNNTQVFDDRLPNAPSEAPLLVAANFAEVTVDSSGIKMTDETTAVEAARVTGDDVTMTVSGGSEFANAANTQGLNVTGASTVNVTGSRFTAPVTVSNAAADLIVHSSSFEAIGKFPSVPVIFHGRDLTIGDNSRLITAPLTFGGRTLRVSDTAIDGGNLPVAPNQAIVQVEAGDSEMHVENVTFKSAPMTFRGGALTIEGLTTFTDSRLQFDGTSLAATDTVFVRQGIWQTSLQSTATLRNVQITNYTQWGYQLSGGTLDVAHSMFERDLSIPVSADGKSPPWALRVDANWDSGSKLISQATSYDSAQPFMPVNCIADPTAQSMCEVHGPDTYKSVYTIVSTGIDAWFSL
jgi:hypothetical protein